MVGLKCAKRLCRVYPLDLTRLYVVKNLKGKKYPVREGRGNVRSVTGGIISHDPPSAIDLQVRVDAVQVIGI